MQTFSGDSYEASDKHKDKSAARKARDVSDTIDLIYYLNERDPFFRNDWLFKIANGVTTQHNLLETKVGKSAEELTFWNANQAVTLRAWPTMENWR